MMLQDLPKSMRPREKLLALGGQALTDTELVAVMLGTGLPGQSVLQLAQHLLDRFAGLAGLLHASPAQLQAVKGLGGSARCAQLVAVLELSSRVLQQKLRKRDAMGNPETVRQFLQLQIGTLDHEVFGVMFLDAQNRLLLYRNMFKGTLNQTSVYPREVVKLALEVGAAAVIFSHNHPSGVVQPSPADTALTRSLHSALAMVDIRVLDHIIVSTEQSWSMAERSPW